MAGGLFGAGPEILTCTLQLFTRDLAVVRSNEVGADEDWGRLAAWDPPLRNGGKVGELGCLPCTSSNVYLIVAEHSFSPLTMRHGSFSFNSMMRKRIIE